MIAGTSARPTLSKSKSAPDGLNEDPGRQSERCECGKQVHEHCFAGSAGFEDHEQVAEGERQNHEHDQGQLVERLHARSSN